MLVAFTVEIQVKNEHSVMETSLNKTKYSILGADGFVVGLLHQFFYQGVPNTLATECVRSQP